MSGAKTSWKDIKPVLSDFSSTQLLGLLQDLYRFSEQNASFMHARFLSEDTQTDHLLVYKKRIQKAINPKQPWKQGIHLAEGRRAISDFKKANGNIRNTLTLMVHYVKCGNDFTLEFGDIDEAFYDSLGSMFSKIIQILIAQNDKDLVAEWLPMLEVEFHRIDGTVGWGYPDELSNCLAELQDAFP